MFESAALIFTLLSQPDLECMAKNIYFEARNQSYSGKVATAHVVMNRVKSEEFPNNVCDVVYQAKLNSNGAPIRNRCQFSWYCDGLSDVPREQDEWIESVRVAQDAVLLWDNNFDLTEGSQFYHSRNVNPWWNRNMTLTVRIDDHLFFRK